MTPKKLKIVQFPLVLMVTAMLAQGIYFRHTSPVWEKMKDIRLEYDLFCLSIITFTLVGYFGLVSTKYWGLVITRAGNFAIFGVLTLAPLVSKLIIFPLSFGSEFQLSIQQIFNAEYLLEGSIGLYALVIGILMVRKDVKAAFPIPV